MNVVDPVFDAITYDDLKVVAVGERMSRQLRRRTMISYEQTLKLFGR